jgi:ATP-binding cassette, subfamily B, bacterial PglK
VYSKLILLFTYEERKGMIFLLIGMLIMSIIEVVGIVSIAPFMSIVIEPESIHTNIYMSVVYQYFKFSDGGIFTMAFGLVVIVVLVFSNSFSAFMTWKIHYFTTLQSYRLSTRLMENYVMQPYEFFLNSNTSELTKNIFNEVDRVIGGVVIPLISIISKTISSILIVVMLVFVDPIMAITSALVLGTSYIFVYKLVNKRLQQIGIKTSEFSKLRYKFVSESMLGIKAIILNGVESEFVERFGSVSKKFANNVAQSSIISSLPRYVLETIAFGGLITIVLILSKQQRNNTEVIVLLSLYAIAGYKLMPALQGIYQGVTQIKYHHPAIDLVANDFALPTRNTALTRHESKPLQFNKNILLQGLNYKYSGTDSMILTDVELEIGINSVVGFVGATGSGKTTIVDILIGLLLPSFGKIKVDNVEIAENNIVEWHKHIGYVPQDIYLTDDSLANNIALGVPIEDIDYGTINKVLKQVELNDFVNSLNDGYNSMVGEQGVRLSGGQKQRIGIARALYHNPGILVFDEATSSLDSLTEIKIMNSIQTLSVNKTIIIVAHRLNTIKKCDVIYFMEFGKIVDKGSFEYLIANNDKFKKMSQA